MKPYAVVAKQERVVAVIVSISKVFASSCRNFAKVLNFGKVLVCCKAFARVIGLAKPSFHFVDYQCIANYKTLVSNNFKYFLEY